VNPLFQLRDIEKAYGNRRVLAVQNLEIVEGSCTGIIGPSGAGKTTLLRILGLLEPPTSGQVLHEGQQVSHPPPIDLRRQITMVFQRPALLDLTTLENVEYGLRLRGIHDQKRVGEMMDLLGIAHLASHAAMSLSGREIQRVAMARALVIQPRALLLDEPTANLDPENVRILEEAITRSTTELGMTVVLISHNLHQVSRLCSTTSAIIDGRLVESGPTGTITRQPANPELAAFLCGGIFM
jgi:tungstate transport system ATP-binding protein